MSYITALVFQKNNDQFIGNPPGIGQGRLELIPTPDSQGYVFADYWAVPLTDGIVSSWQYIPKKASDVTKPDPQAVAVVRINAYNNPDTYYVLGTSTDYMNASTDVDCCTSPARAMPTAVNPIAPCQALCADSNGNQFGAFGIPTDTGTYLIAGYYNGVALPNLSAAAAPTIPITMNANATWKAIGTWAISGDGLTLTVTGAAVSNPDAPNVLCVSLTLE